MKVKTNQNPTESKTLGQFGTPVIVGTQEHKKRSNIDDIGGLTHVVVEGKEYLGSKHIIVDLDESGEHIEIRLDKDIVDSIIPREVAQDDMTITPTSAASTISFLIADDIHYEGKHINLMFEVENSGVHYGGNVIVHPADESQCFSGGRLLVNGSFKDFSATIDENGQISIVVYGVEFGSTDIVKVHYTVLLND